MDDLDRTRRQRDVLVDIIMGNGDALDTVCSKIVERLRTTRPNLSRRVDAMFNVALKSDCRVAKHGIIFFALHLEPWAVDILCESGRLDPKKYGAFKSSDLEKSTDQLLNGAHTSLRSYVEEIRLLYMIS